MCCVHPRWLDNGQEVCERVFDAGVGACVHRTLPGSANHGMWHTMPGWVGCGERLAHEVAPLANQVLAE